MAQLIARFRNKLSLADVDALGRNPTEDTHLLGLYVSVQLAVERFGAGVLREENVGLRQEIGGLRDQVAENSGLREENGGLRAKIDQLEEENARLRAAALASTE